MPQPILTEYQLLEQIQKQVQTIAAQQEDAAEQASKMYSTLTRQITKLSKSVDGRASGYNFTSQSSADHGESTTASAGHYHPFT